MSKKQFSIRLEMDLYEKLNSYKWDNRKSLNDVVAEAVERFLEQIDNDVEGESKTG